MLFDLLHNDYRLHHYYYRHCRRHSMLQLFLNAKLNESFSIDLHSKYVHTRVTCFVRMKFAIAIASIRKVAVI